MFVIEVDSAPVLNALNRLLQAGQDVSPILRAIGEDITTRAKLRFRTTTAPDGAAWAANKPSTIEAYVKAKGGYSKKTGKLLKKGALLQSGKKPLQGLSGDLARQIFATVDGNALTVGVSPIYAAMQQFGGKKSEFPHLWGDIPARPFLPVTQDGKFYPEEERWILARLGMYLSGSVE
jgi:phage virion morphogenesis protein